MRNPDSDVFHALILGRLSKAADPWERPAKPFHQMSPSEFAEHREVHHPDEAKGGRYWEQHNPDEQQKLRAKKASEQEALFGRKYPISGTFSGDPVVIHGVADTEQHANVRIPGVKQAKSFGLMMEIERNGEREHAFPESLADESGAPLVTRFPRARPMTEDHPVFGRLQPPEWVRWEHIRHIAGAGRNGLSHEVHPDSWTAYGSDIPGVRNEPGVGEQP